MNLGIPLTALLISLPAVACVSADKAGPPTNGSDPTASTQDAVAQEAARESARLAAEEADFLQQLSQAMAHSQTEDPAALMTSLERLLPAWESEQRKGREAPIERILTLKVVVNIDTVIGAFDHGARERQLVAAWALGFARVPQNELNAKSPHARAREKLVLGLRSRDDALLRNVLLGLWKLQDPDTPLPPLLDLMVQHHDPDVRSNATLAVGAVLDERTLSVALDSILVALADKEPKVRLHASAIAREHPSPRLTQRLLEALPGEEVPLVRASMAAALGAAHSRAATPLLLSMLDSSREIESATARAALVEIYGEDRGARAADWAGLAR